ncbi:hypothetical protein IIA28_19370 [candidate division KSB1 bacterium]|nr:hypothetical protein [candidate division KSB1 bacterium]
MATFTLSNFTKNAQTGFFNALTALQHSDGLIADIRHNRGGSLGALRAIVSRFTTTTFPSLPGYFSENTSHPSLRQSYPRGHFDIQSASFC